MPAESPILTQTIRINFYPNSANVYEPQHDEVGRPIANTLYDPNVDATLEKVARLVGPVRAGASSPWSGHTDSSMKGKGTALRGREAALAWTARPRSRRRW